MSKKRKKIKWEPDPKSVGPYFYPLTGYWIQYHTKEELERRSRLGSEDGDRMFRELARSLLVGNAAVVAFSITTVTSLFGNGQSISPAIPLVTLLGTIGIGLSGFAQLLIARRAQNVGAGYEAFRFWRFSESAATPLDDNALKGFEKSYEAFRDLWDKQKETYTRLLRLSLFSFLAALLVAIIHISVLLT